MSRRLKIETTPSGPMILEFLDDVQLKGDKLSYKTKNPEGYSVGDYVLFSEMTASWFNRIYRDSPVLVPTLLDSVMNIIDPDIDFGDVQLAFLITSITAVKEGNGTVGLQAYRLNKETKVPIVIKGMNGYRILSLNDFFDSFINKIELKFALNFAKYFSFALVQGSVMFAGSAIKTTGMAARMIPWAQKIEKGSGISSVVIRRAAARLIRFLASKNVLPDLTKEWTFQFGRAFITHKRMFLDDYLTRKDVKFNELFWDQVNYSGTIAMSKVLERQLTKKLGLDTFPKELEKLLDGNGEISKWVITQVLDLHLEFVQGFINPFRLFRDFMSRMYKGDPSSTQILHLKDSFFSDFFSSAIKRILKELAEKLTEMKI